MGLPIEQIVVATNQNDILYRFFAHADYSARPVVPSLAPAMDIVIPSNFERFLFWIADCNPVTLSAYMKSIKETGKFDFGERQEELMAKIRSMFSAGRASDAEINTTVDQYRKSRKYLLCPHSACGLHTLEQVRREERSYICFATAHPAKFGEALEETRHMEPRLPPQLEGLLSKPKRCQFSPNNPDSVKAIVESTLLEKSSKKSGKGQSSEGGESRGSQDAAPAVNWAAIAGAWLLGAGTAWLLAKKYSS